jgi:DNA-binding protein HU-beta
MISRTMIGKEISRQLHLSQSAGKTAADIVLETIEAALARGEDVRMKGFGTFAVRHLPAHEGRNPFNGEKIAISASIGVKFRPHGALKAALKAAPGLVPIRKVGGERKSPMHTNAD